MQIHLVAFRCDFSGVTKKKLHFQQAIAHARDQPELIRTRDIAVYPDGLVSMINNKLIPIRINIDSSQPMEMFVSFARSASCYLSIFFHITITVYFSAILRFSHGCHLDVCQLLSFFPYRSVSEKFTSAYFDLDSAIKSA